MKLLLLALAILLPSCCTDIGCLSGINLNFIPPGGTVADGRYDLTVDVDGIELTCSQTVSGGVGTMQCTDGAIIIFSPLVFHVITAEVETVRVTMLRDGSQLFDDTLELDFEEDPNFDGCGDCPRAELEVELP